ncbi:P-loop containing nucleoside triphosphate hydrolase protein [Massariosphaeria phaeospora]|uniref:Gluconokinase n=1 Tax=Massariosphaeria phaeospora TaxID=100035 RepID=A0A7C8MCM7_9PLEO|nr:P-loop containing nucleoside triphosphate hydrolase protein [Massariosphaeria phaeospora]
MLQTFDPTHPKPLHYASAPTPPVSSPGSPSNTASNATKAAPAMCVKSHHHILIVTGPAGCGKSTVAKFLSARYGFEYVEGDDFHPPTNIEKMANNIPLDDADRWDWLILLRDQALAALTNGAKGVVVTCSALKKKYRDVIRTARLYDEDPNANVHFVYLRASKETLLARVGARQGHYMKDAMVISQLAALEEPDDAEIKRLKDVEIIDVTGGQSEVEKLTAAAIDSILMTES